MTTDNSNIIKTDNLADLAKYLSFLEFNLLKADKAARDLSKTIKNLPQYHGDLFVIEKMRVCISECFRLIDFSTMSNYPYH